MSIGDWPIEYGPQRSAVPLVSGLPSDAESHADVVPGSPVLPGEGDGVVEGTLGCGEPAGGLGDGDAPGIDLRAGDESGGGFEVGNEHTSRVVDAAAGRQDEADEDES